MIYLNARSQLSEKGTVTALNVRLPDVCPDLVFSTLIHAESVVIGHGNSHYTKRWRRDDTATVCYIPWDIFFFNNTRLYLLRVAGLSRA